MKNKKQKVGDLGQHWTPYEIVDFMVSLLDPLPKEILEPTAGSGRFVRKLLEMSTDIAAIEIDASVIPEDIKNLYKITNFFKWNGKKYDAIIGNPPYVAGKLIKEDVVYANGSLPKTANLYLHVIEKCVKEHLNPGGQLVFIVPDTLFDGTSRGKNLREWMLANGSFTHILNPKVQWEKASVETVVFRWVMGKKQESVQTNDGAKNLISKNGTIKLLNWKPFGFFGDFFDVGVGAAPRADLETSSQDINGKSFLKSGELKWYKVDNTKIWPRWRTTKLKHKFLMKPGPTRSKKIIYSTTKWPLDQSTRHLDICMEPSFDIQMDKFEELEIYLNDWFEKNDKELGIRKAGRWIANTSQIINLPIDENFYEKMQYFMKFHEEISNGIL